MSSRLTSPPLPPLQPPEPQQLTSKTMLVTLPDLKAWTWYCVTVQSRADFFNKSSSFTPPHCLQTEGKLVSS